VRWFCKEVAWCEMERELNKFDEEGYDPYYIERNPGSDIFYLIMVKRDDPFTG
jgi:hypothetical protein